MCGIAGSARLTNNALTQAQLQGMAEAIRYRGPDDSGFFESPSASFAFRRLAIIDLTPAGHQPMSNEDGSIRVIFNGEIYNYRELRKRLIQRGHTFQSQSDTETIVHAYEEYGENCVHKLKGMFAFAIWDGAKRKLFCARDRFGVKPLYYASHQGRFIFASEIKAILKTGYPVRLNMQAFHEYFTFQNIYSDLTLFDGIHLLPPGHSLIVQDGQLKTQQYWTPEFRPDTALSEGDFIERIRHGMQTAVERHMISDVPVGSHSSGGLDSASIIAYASKVNPHLMTFTGGFDTTNASGLEIFFDERRDAELVSRHYHTHQYEMVIHAGDMMRIMPTLIWHLEDLRVGMCYQNYYINQLAGKFVKVVLAGTGGDELFGGYPWRYELIKNARDTTTFNNIYYKYWSRLLDDTVKAGAFSELTQKQLSDHSTRAVFESVLSGTDTLNPLDRALFFEMKTFLHGLLVVEDKVSSAHSLESRVPFLDYDLVDLALKIPASMKVRGKTGKAVLRKAMRGVLPPAILKKKKQGFSAPEETWYRGQAFAYIQEILLSERSLGRGYFQPSFIRRVLKDHRGGTQNHRLMIWSLLSFEWWCRIFLDGEGVNKS